MGNVTKKCEHKQVLNDYVNRRILNENIRRGESEHALHNNNTVWQ